MNIRNFQPSDYSSICFWWKTAKEVPVPLKHMPESTTFVCEDEYGLIASLGYFTTNTDIALVQNFIAHPAAGRELRRQASTALSEFVDQHAKANGFNILTGFTSKEKLAQRYTELGYAVTPIFFVGKEI